MPDRSARGSVLILVPAGVLVVIIVAAIAVDMGVVYLGQRQLADAAVAAANDAAGAGLSDSAFYRQGAVSLDPQRVSVVVCAAMRAQTGEAVRHLTVEVAVSGPAVAVRARGLVDEVFGRTVPGLRAARPVRAEAQASAVSQNGARFRELIDFHPLSC